MKISGRLMKRTACKWIPRFRSINTSRSGTACNRRASRPIRCPISRSATRLNGPVNGKPSWWSPDNANFAPRFGLAYAPADHAGLLGKLFGKSGAFRAGGAIAYDQFGNDLIVNYDQFGSLGLSDPTNFPDSYSFTTSPRFTGTFPALPPAAAGGFPYTPPAIAAITGTFLGISPDLKTPYSIVLNANYSRQLPGKVTMEVGYMGRLSRRLLMEGDVYTPLENYKDPGSGDHLAAKRADCLQPGELLWRKRRAFPTTTPRPWWRRK